VKANLTVLWICELVVFFPMHSFDSPPVIMLHSFSCPVLDTHQHTALSSTEYLSLVYHVPYVIRIRRKRYSRLAQPRASNSLHITLNIDALLPRHDGLQCPSNGRRSGVRRLCTVDRRFQDPWTTMGTFPGHYHWIRWFAGDVVDRDGLRVTISPLPWPQQILDGPCFRCRTSVWSDHAAPHWCYSRQLQVPLWSQKTVHRWRRSPQRDVPPSPWFHSKFCVHSYNMGIPSCISLSFSMSGMVPYEYCSRTIF